MNVKAMSQKRSGLSLEQEHLSAQTPRFVCSQNLSRRRTKDETRLRRRARLMGWARMDDGYMDHPKILEAGPWAELLDRRAIEYCAAHDTDGLVTKSALKKIGREIPKMPSRVLALVTVGRWVVNEGGGWWVHDFLLFNPSKAERNAVRASGRERQAAWRERARNAVTNGEVTKGRGGGLLSGSKIVVEMPTTEPPWVAQGITRAEWVEAGRQGGGTG